jgi:hypothetical protein
MLYLILVWTLLSIGCYSCGVGVLNLLKISTISRSDNVRTEMRWQRAIIAIWLGVLAIAIMLLTIGLLMPLSPQIGGCLLVAGVLVALRWRSSRLEILTLCKSISRVHLLIYLSVTIATAALFSGAVGWYDSGLYHYSSIRWLANFGTVPGLSLLFPNFGFTSAWFAFSAPLNPNWSIDRTGATANGFVFLLAVLQLLISIERCCGRETTPTIRQQAQLSDWFVVIAYSCVLLMTIQVSLMRAILISPSPDIPALLLVLITAWTILVVETDPRSDRFTPSRQIVPLLLAVGAVAIKLTALPLLVVTGLWFVVRAGWNRQIIGRIGIVVVVSLLLMPLLLSSIVTSGCPIYPSSTFCLDLPWAVGANQSVANDTHHWISWYGRPPAGINPWLWAFQLWLKTAGNKFIIAMIALFAGCSIYLLKTRSSSAARIGSIWLIAIAAAGSGFFLLTSPLNRFMLPYLFLVPALALATYLHAHFATDAVAQPSRWRSGMRIVEKWPIDRARTATILLLSIATISVATQVQSNYVRLLLPSSLTRIATIKHQINDVTYFSPVGGKNKGCWTIELPCAYTPAQIRLRNPLQGIKAGFLRN